MARPKKKTVDYFPHQCVSGQTIFILEQRFGNDGYAFWFKLLEFLGTKEGHFIDYRNDSDWEFLQAKTRIVSQTTIEILDLLAKLGAIDKELWGEKVIWSQKFVDNIADVYINRRVEIPPKPSFYEGKLLQMAVSTPHNPTIGAVSTSKSTQRKGKESKGEERKGNNPIQPDLNSVFLYFKTGIGGRLPEPQIKETSAKFYNHITDWNNWEAAADVWIGKERPKKSISDEPSQLRKSTEV